MFRVKLRSFQDTSDRPHVKFNTQQLRNQETKQTFSIILKNKFSSLDSITEETPIEEHWKNVKETFLNTLEETLGRKKRHTKEWATTETWNKIEERRMKKQEINNCSDKEENKILNTAYPNINKEVKKK